MAHTKRFWRTVRRLLAEVTWIRVEQRALERLVGTKTKGLDFFRVAHTALLGDRLLRLVRVLEDSTRVSSFWYLYRCAPMEFANVDVRRLQSISKRLKSIRDKTFIHIDKRAVFNPEAIYQQAGITGREIVWAIETVWNELTRLHAQRPSGETEYRPADYSGDDILELVELRDRGDPQVTRRNLI